VSDFSSLPCCVRAQALEASVVRPRSSRAGPSGGGPKFHGYPTIPELSPQDRISVSGRSSQDVSMIHVPDVHSCGIFSVFKKERLDNFSVTMSLRATKKCYRAEWGSSSHQAVKGLKYNDLHCCYLLLCRVGRSVALTCVHTVQTQLAWQRQYVQIETRRSSVPRPDHRPATVELTRVHHRFGSSEQYNNATPFSCAVPH
jgi:hypothetical protein